MTPLRLYIAGTHSSGKTTLARRIEMELRATGITVVRTGGFAKRAAELGFPKMTRHTAQSTAWIINTTSAATLEAELTADVVIVDRTPYDALAYYLAALQHRGEHPDPEALSRLTGLAQLACPRPAVFLATVLDPALPVAVHPGKDPDRADTAFREAVDQQLHRALKAYHVPHIPVPGDGHAAAVEAAVETIASAWAAAA
ncbi:ATP-binding protein [Kitasatospora sp. NBC_01287]|uniref:AAA family ATPase n=1 Tax=Kitasatospora sp. NBC_01287 TaxID=2903573 RepID=UPI00225950F0|nr:AAA family ATPase [Kitasatospora sp. NBC_01287]MCX4751609.1 ATP-binding protein [Kitasatospora sp. NBC_01287]